MRAVKIYNIKQNYDFIMYVKGRIHPHPKICQNLNDNGKHLFAILSDRTGIIRLVAYSEECNVDAILQKLKTDKIISISGSIEVCNELKGYTFHKYHLKLDNNSVIEYINYNTVKPMDFPMHRFKSGKDLINNTSNTLLADVKGNYLGETKTIEHENSYTTHSIQIGLSKIILNSWDKFVNAKYPVGTCLKIYNAAVENINGNCCVICLNMYSHVQCVGIEPENGSNIEIEEIDITENNNLLNSPDETEVTVPKEEFLNQSVYLGRPPSNNPMPELIMKISRELPNQITQITNQITPIKRKNTFEDQVMLKIKKMSSSKPTEQVMDLFNAFLTVLINMPDNDAKCDFLRKSFK